MDLTDVVKAMLVPGSTGLLLLGLTLALALMLAGERTRRWGVGCLAGLAMVYWLLALPITASTLERFLSTGLAPVAEAEGQRGETAILVFGGGTDTFRAEGLGLSVPGEATALRALEGARMYRLLSPAIVISSGGPGGEAGKGEPESKVIRRVLEEMGVPADQILEESSSSSTREEAVVLAAMLADGDMARVVVVTSPTHMRRALGSMAAVGVDAIGSPSREHSESRRAASPILPSERALGDSRQALREVMALVYYAARGWLAPVPTP